MRGMETNDHTTPRRITRSRDDRMLGGVCGGIAKHIDIDPVIVRIATIVLVCAVGVGAVAYVAAWILMPLDEQPRDEFHGAPLSYGT
jgi:phage shock protein C